MCRRSIASEKVARGSHHKQVNFDSPVQDPNCGIWGRVCKIADKTETCQVIPDKADTLAMSIFMKTDHTDEIKEAKLTYNQTVVS